MTASVYRASQAWAEKAAAEEAKASLTPDQAIDTAHHMLDAIWRKTTSQAAPVSLVKATAEGLAAPAEGAQDPEARRAIEKLSTHADAARLVMEHAVGSEKPVANELAVNRATDMLTAQIKAAKAAVENSKAQTEARKATEEKAAMVMSARAAVQDARAEASAKKAADEQLSKAEAAHMATERTMAKAEAKAEAATAKAV